jgi:hypothetical protein
MTRHYVADQEASFLALMARRLLNHQREAKSRGETFNDLTTPVPLGCGVRAKLTFVECPSGYKPEVVLVRNDQYTAEELYEIASEILGGPADNAYDPAVDGQSGRFLRFCLKPA